MKRVLLIPVLVALVALVAFLLSNREEMVLPGGPVGVPESADERPNKEGKELSGETGGEEIALLPGPRKAPMVKSPAPVPEKPIRMADLIAHTDRLSNPDANAEADLEVLSAVLQSYKKFVGEVPEGGLNEEIVDSLCGKNPRRIIFMDRAHPSISEEGELLDRFETPYYFHPVSAQELEFRSAGPDKKLWSDDDVIPD